MRIVMASGVWDLLHVGHTRLLSRAKFIGDKLVVCINSDEKAAKYKRPPIFSEDARLEIVFALRWVDAVVLCHDMDLCPYILAWNVDVLVHGDDVSRKKYLKQIHLTEKWLKDNEVKLILIPHTKGVSTGMIREKLNC